MKNEKSVAGLSENNMGIFEVRMPMTECEKVGKVLRIVGCKNDNFCMRLSRWNNPAMVATL